MITNCKCETGESLVRLGDKAEENHQSRGRSKKSRKLRLDCFDPEHISGGAKVDVIVIGSGMGGLTAAAKLAEAGKRVLLFEQHNVVGGCTHTFVENGAEFETGLHYIGAGIMDPTSGSRQILDSICDRPTEWEPIGDGEDRVYDVVRISDQEESGETAEFRVPAHREKYIHALTERFPGDRDAIRAFFEAVSLSQQKVAGHFIAQGIRRFLRAVPLGGLGICFLLQKLVDRLFRRPFWKYTDQTISDVLTRLLPDNAKLRAILSYLWGDCGSDPSKASFAILAMITNHYLPGACFLRGGSATLAEQIVPFIERYNGSRVFVRSPVQSIMVNSRGSASGVVVKANGACHTVLAPIIINCTGAANTAKFLEESAPSAVPDDLPPQSTGHLSLFIRFSSKVFTPGSANHWVFSGTDHAKNVVDFNRDPEYAPFPAVFFSFPSAKDPSRRDSDMQTCHVVTQVPYEVFSKVLGEEQGRPRKRNQAYEILKQRFADRLFSLVEREFPDLWDAITDTDVIRGRQCSLGTPMSSEYFLRTMGGASYGVEASPSRFRSLACQVETLIPGLYQGGHDVVSAGVTGAMMGGYFAALLASPWAMIGPGSKVGSSNRRILFNL